MIDSIETGFILNDSAEAPSLDRLEKLGESTDRYATSRSSIDAVSLRDKINNPSVSPSLNTHATDAGWFTLLSLYNCRRGSPRPQGWE